MATETHIRAALGLLLAAGAVVAGTSLRPADPAPRPAPFAGAVSIGADYGRDAVQPDSKRPKIEATFTRESYRRGETATLALRSPAREVTVQLCRAGTQPDRILANDLMEGAPAAPAVRVGAVEAGRTLRLRIGDWPSGVYFARLAGAGEKLGFAPFVLRPTRLGEHRIAVVQPTTRGRPTTSVTRTGTASATPGTRASATRPSTSSGRS